MSLETIPKWDRQGLHPTKSYQLLWQTTQEESITAETDLQMLLFPMPCLQSQGGKSPDG